MPDFALALAPAQASTAASRTDLIFLGLLLVSGFIVLLVTTLIVTFAVRYRNGSRIPRTNLANLTARHIEIGWTIATLFAFLFFFGWAAAQEFQILAVPADALTIHILGKQWMWKAEHPGGQREIDALHVPVGRYVRLVMNSQDVIHSFFIPAFRLKHDVVPGLTETLSFRATRTGTFPLFCAEFCGTQHSRMRGEVTVMSAEDYARWTAAQPEGDTLAQEGAALFRSLGCSGCHFGKGTVRAPNLAGLYGRPVPLSDGRVVVADERYIRDSILQPKSQVVAGYAPVMPSFAGKVREADLVRLVAYIRSLRNSPSQVSEGEQR